MHLYFPAWCMQCGHGSRTLQDQLQLSQLLLQLCSECVCVTAIFCLQFVPSTLLSTASYCTVSGHRTFTFNIIHTNLIEMILCQVEKDKRR